MTDLPIAKKLKAEEPLGMLSGSCDNVRLTNPNGPEALAIIEAQHEALKHFIDIIDGTKETGFDPHVEQMLMDAADASRAAINLARGVK